MISKLNPVLGLVLLFLSSISSIVESRCTRGCDLALGSYNVWAEANLSFVAEVLHDSINDILSYNLQVTNQDSILTDTRINIPFSCDCINGDFLGHVFTYSVRPGDTYDSVANLYYANLTTVEWTRRFNSYPPERIPDTDATLNVTVNCSCGDRSVSRKYGLFVTYPLMPGESLESVAAENNLTADLLRRYNPNSNFSAGEGLVFVPGRDKNGKYPPLNASRGFSGGSTAGICVGGLAGLLLLAGCLYFGFYRRRKEDMIALLSKASLDPSRQAARGATFVKAAGSTGQFVAVPPGLTGIMVDKSVEFSYEELAEATDDFSIANKIGQGGFGTVYYAELRGETAAIKKMDMQASREFLAELKVLTNVHHLNLVRLIGYCVERSLFLVYEYIENGNLNQHLRGSGVHPLTWSTRVKIALDSARGLEYIHEHTVPVYIHRDIKSANILIDKNFRAKVITDDPRVISTLSFMKKVHSNVT